MSTSRRDLRTSGDLVMAPRVPHGLAAAVEGLTREVIRHRPEDIYVFAAQHFEELLKLRDEYGAVTNLPGKSTNNNSALREMNKALKKRSGIEKSGERGGWSMNETARVLERHRSIFGDKGRKVSTDEVRALGNEKENKSGYREDLEMLVTSTRRRPGSNERFVKRKMPKENSSDTQEVRVKSDAGRNPKIISQIPTLNQAGGLLAKDIKSELRKNRNSSRDRRSMRDRAERKSTERLEIASRHGAAKKTLTRSSRETSLDKLTENDGDSSHTNRIGANNQKQKTEAGARVLSKIPRTLSMDRVREFVVKKFRSSESWEELTSSNYVDRVQEVIDDAAPSILRKVNELNTRSAGRSSRGYESVDESTSTSTRSDKSNQTDDVRSRSAMSGSRRSRKSRRTTKSKISGADSLEGIETLASETEQVKETGNDAEPKKMSSTESETSPSPNLSLPAVRPPSSKNHSRSVSRSDSDNLVLPPISPDAPKSAKLKEELVLPSLQITREVLRASDDVELTLPDPPTDEIFKDSLNVTPEMAASPRPDSLEPDSGVRNEAEAVAVGNFDTETAPASVREKLIEIQEAEERLRSILDSGQEEKLMEAEEAENIFEPEAPTVQEVEKELGMKEKLMEIEESEKRIEKILNPDPQDVQELGMKEKLIEIAETEKRIEKILNPEAKDVQEEKDFGIKEKLIEIQESEKRIEKILNPETKSDENDAGFMKDKLMEIEEAEKRLTNIFESNQNLEAINSAPKTPFIPEIPSEYVTTANEVVVTPDGAEHSQLPEESNSADDTNDGLKEPKGREVEIISSGTPDSLGTSYVLTEGSPYEIPDSVTTVIIPERTVDTPSSDIVEIVLEDDTEERYKKSEEGEILLRNILDNFGEIVDQEIPVGPSALDVDFIRNLKTSNDIIITRKDLALIREEEDKEIAETEAASMALTDIAESEEILEIHEAKGDAEEELKDRQSPKKHEDTLLHLEEAKEALEDRNTETSGSLDPEVSPEDGANRKVVNITDSGTTESTDEVKETTISDDGGNTAAESSVTSPSCGEDVDARNSESSNEVKETTISDQLADGNGKNLLSLAPQCFGSMPHVPELNLDSLQDITVSSFQLSDDQTAEEDSEAGPPQSGNETSHASQDREPVVEEIIVKERLAVKEDPCTKVNTYVTEPDTDNVDAKEELEAEAKQETKDACENIQEVHVETVKELLTEKEPEEELIEVHEDVLLGDVAETMFERSSKDVLEKESEEKSEDVHEHLSKDLVEEGTEARPEVVHEQTVAVEDVTKKVIVKEPEQVHKEEVIEEVTEKTLDDTSKDATDKLSEIVLQKVTDEVREEISKQEADQTSKEDPEEVLKGVTEKILEVEPEKILEEASKDVAEKSSEEKPENVLGTVSDELDDKETEKEPEEIHEEKPEEKHDQNPGGKLEGKPEEHHEYKQEEKLEGKSEEHHGDKHEEKLAEEPEDKHENKSEEHHEGLLDEVVKVVAKKEPEEVHEVRFEKILEERLEEKPEKILGPISNEMAKHEVKKEPEEGVSKFKISEMDAIGSTSLTTSPAELEEEKKPSDSAGRDVKPEFKNEQVPEVTVDHSASVKLDNLVAAVAGLDPPKAEVVTNDLDDHPNAGERMEYHIYVPEVAAAESQDGNSTTESSTFNSAATKIQAGVRGFLTRRRLQSAQRRSSTLDSVPSIQDSVGADASHLEPIEEVGLAQAATTIQSNYRGYKARQRLRREDAVQKTTMSVDNPFGGEGLQHTGEFHDCLPLPLFQHPDVDGGKSQDSLSDSSKDNQNLIVISGNDSALQSQYLNFITSIEEVPDETDHSIIIQDAQDTSKLVIDALSTLKSTAEIESLPLDNPSVDSSVSIREPLAVPGTPTGLIIEELSKTEDEVTSLDLPGLSLEGVVDDNKEPSLGTMSFSMNVDDMLGLGAEGDPASKMKPILEVTFTPRDLPKLSNVSTSGERVESPVTMMQIAPKSVDDDRETKEPS